MEAGHSAKRPAAWQAWGHPLELRLATGEKRVEWGWLPFGDCMLLALTDCERLGTLVECVGGEARVLFGRTAGDEWLCALAELLAAAVAERAGRDRRLLVSLCFAAGDANCAEFRQALLAGFEAQLASEAAFVLQPPPTGDMGLKLA